MGWGHRPASAGLTPQTRRPSGVLAVTSPGRGHEILIGKLGLAVKWAGCSRLSPTQPANVSHTSSAVPLDLGTHQARLLSLPLTIFFSFALVMLFFAFGQANFDFDAATREV